MITRTRYIQKSLLLIALIWSCANINAQSKTASSKPNVIYIFADDLGYGELGSYGQKKIKTPHLDKLAKEGMRFTQHYTGTPVCAPSRCNLLTGRHSGKAYIRGNYGLPGYEENKSETGQFPIPQNTPTIATLFKQAGYATAAIGKWGLGNYGSSGDPLKHGFDFFYGYYDQRHAHNYYTTHLYKNGQWDTLANPVIDVHPKLVSDKLSAEEVKAYIGKEYAIDKMTSQALGFIEGNKSQSFFLYLPYTLPHAALQVPQADIEYYINLFNEQPTYTKGGYTPTLYPLSTYAAMITYLDKQVGLIQEQLKKLGLDENTIILFSSDNGPASSIGVNNDFFNSAGSFKGRKQDVYEGGIREPFIARWPGKIPAGKINPTISAQYDMMATFADLLKVSAPENDGVSLLPTLLGNDKNQKQHEFLYWEYPERGGQLAIRMGKWKGVKTDLLKNPQAKWQLYNLEADPKESTDVAEKHPELIKQFDAIVQKEHTPPVREEWNIFK
jgi:arylsulfatase A-like enzyme